MRGCKKNNWVRHSLPFVTAYMGLSKWPCDASPILVDYLWRLFGIGIRLNKNKHLTVVIGRCVCPPSLKCKQFLLHYIWLAPFQLSVLACDIVGVPVWTSFGALLKLLSQPCLWTYFPLFLDRTFGSVLALVHSLPCQGLHDPIINSYGTVPVGEGRVCTGSCLAPSSFLPIPQPALADPKARHPRNMVSKNGSCWHFHNRSAWVLLEWMASLNESLTEQLLLLWPSVTVARLERS